MQAAIIIIIIITVKHSCTVKKIQLYMYIEKGWFAELIKIIRLIRGDRGVSADRKSSITALIQDRSWHFISNNKLHRVSEPFTNIHQTSASTSCQWSCCHSGAQSSVWLGWRFFFTKWLQTEDQSEVDRTVKKRLKHAGEPLPSEQMCWCEWRTWRPQLMVDYLVYHLICAQLFMTS